MRALPHVYLWIQERHEGVQKVQKQSHAGAPYSTHRPCPFLQQTWDASTWRGPEAEPRISYMPESAFPTRQILAWEIEK